MRRIFLAVGAGIIVAGIAAGATGWYLYGRTPNVAVETLEQFVPQDAFYYFSSRQLADKIDEAGESAFWAACEATPFYIRRLEPFIERYREKYALIRYLLTEENALAVFIDGGAPSLSDMFESRSNGRPLFLFLCRVPQDNAQLLKTSLAGIFLPASGKASRQDYRRFPITSFAIPSSGMTVHAALVAGILVLSNDYPLLCRSIDCVLDREANASLASLPDFASLCGQLDTDALLWGYANTKRLYEEMLKQQALAVSSSSGPQGHDALAALEASKPFAALVEVLRGSAFSVAYGALKTGLVIRSVSAFNREQDSQGFADVLAPKQTLDPSALRLISDQRLLFLLWAQDAKKIWQYYLTVFGSFEKMARVRLSEGMSFQDALAQVESKLGVGIEDDVLPRLAETFGVVLEGFDEEEIVPAQRRVPADPIRPGAAPPGMEYTGRKQKITIPRAYAFAKVQDAVSTAEKARITVNHLIGKLNDLQMKHVQSEDIAAGLNVNEPLLRMVDAEYAGTRISSLKAAAPLDFLSPSLFLLGDRYLVLATSRFIAERVIDTYQASSGDNLPEPYSSITALDLEKALHDLTAAANWPAMKENIQRQTRGAWAAADFDAALNVLTKIKNIEVRVKNLSTDTVETVCTVTVEGL